MTTRHNCFWSAPGIGRAGHRYGAAAVRRVQLDLGAAKTVRFAWLTLTPKVDLFNLLNSDDYTAIVTASGGAQFGSKAYGQPAVVLQGRLVRLGIDVRW